MCDVADALRLPLSIGEPRQAKLIIFNYLRTLSRSFALFCRPRQLIYRLFNSLCTLYQKHRGVLLGEGQPQHQILVWTMSIRHYASHSGRLRQTFLFELLILARKNQCCWWGRADVSSAAVPLSPGTPDNFFSRGIQKGEIS